MSELESTIDNAWETRATLTPQNAPAAVRDAVAQVITGLDAGQLRVAAKEGGVWTTHQWIKKAVLLSFRLAETGAMRFERRAGSAEPFAFYDKVPTKFSGLSDDQLAAAGVRIVPPAVARRGAYVAKNVVLMP
jgi:2,3,4,5-tetrahydropyridine-2-carboxylate N-succinyltransferase